MERVERASFWDKDLQVQAVNNIGALMILLHEDLGFSAYFQCSKEPQEITWNCAGKVVRPLIAWR